ncbi:phage holin family protein [Apibacter sp.]|uniref:phage holin family protein n=1 Tax=Apibacter sp. TaxID=2023709 RepID=UPI0025DE542A|nr:phage holin family protein [Apibacter sp.]MCT6869857.1 phage holin family protein [Apibacter sp.]
MLGFLKKYINNRIELLKLDLTETISGLLSIIIFIIIVFSIGMMFLLLASFALGIMIGSYFNNLGLGILIISCIYLILFIILLTNYSSIRKYIMRRIIEMHLNVKENELNDKN